MTDVLLVAGALPRQQAVLAEAIGRFRGVNARVHLAGHFDPDELLPEIEPTELHTFGKPPSKMARRAASPREVWLWARRDRWLRQRARRADLLVAVDQAAVHTVWQLAQRHRRAVALFGLAPALKLVEAGAAQPAQGQRAAVSTPSLAAIRFEARYRTMSAAKSTVRMTVAPRAMRVGPIATLWRAAVAMPGIPDGLRARLTNQVRVNLTAAGRPAIAAQACLAAANRTRDTRLRAGLLVDTVVAELATGQVPEHLPAVSTSELSRADTFLRKGDTRRAAESLVKILTLTFHRGIHFDQLRSPLAEHPEEFLGQLYRSTTMRTVSTPRHRSTPAAPGPSDRPLRLLFATLANDGFLREIRRRYESMAGAVEVRFLDFATDPVLAPLARQPERVAEHRLTGGSAYGAQVEERLRPELDWADTVFVDWCRAPAALFTLVDPGSTRIVVRLHSYEAFDRWPHLVDFSRVDDLIFVSEHLRDLTTEIIPQLRGAAAPRMPVIANAMDLDAYPRPKSAGARFNLGLVGHGSMAKDPRWAVEVLRLLRADDPRYRLLLIGSGLKADVSAAARRYHDALERDLAPLAPSGAVVRVGQTDDVPAALTEVGVIVSSSVRESFHCGLVEGAASGAVPVVRDWPFFAGKTHSARSLFPPDWVVGTPQEAADRIRRMTASEDTWREAGAAAASHVLDTWNWQVVQHDFDRLLLAPANSDEPVGGTR